MYIYICRDRYRYIGAFPKIRGTLFGGPYNEDCNAPGGLYWSPLSMGNLESPNYGKLLCKYICIYMYIH